MFYLKCNPKFDWLVDSLYKIRHIEYKNSEIAVLEVWISQKFSLPPTMVGALTQSCIKNGGS